MQHKVRGDTKRGPTSFARSKRSRGCSGKVTAGRPDPWNISPIVWRRFWQSRKKKMAAATRCAFLRAITTRMCHDFGITRQRGLKWALYPQFGPVWRGRERVGKMATDKEDACVLGEDKWKGGSPCALKTVIFFLYLFFACFGFIFLFFFI